MPEWFITSRLKRIWPWLVTSAAIHGLLLLFWLDTRPLLAPSGKGADFVIDLVSLDVNPEPEISTMPAPHRAKPEQPVISPSAKALAALLPSKALQPAVVSKASTGPAEQAGTYTQPDYKADAGKIDNVQMQTAEVMSEKQKSMTRVSNSAQSKALYQPSLPRPAQKHARQKTDSGERNKVRLRVRDHLESFKYYPASARRRGIEGHADVGFTLTRDGAAEQIALLHSSGFAVLDHAALDTVHRAQPFPIEDGRYRFRLRFKRL